MALNLLFVCTGNTCRSPMAEALFRRLLSFDPRERFKVSSAGTQAYAGAPATPEAVQVMAESDIDIASHRSRPLTGPLLEETDLILTLSAGEKAFILSHFPSAAGKTFLLSGYANRSNEGTDIPDPIGMPIDTYRRVRDDIQALLLLLLDKMH